MNLVGDTHSDSCSSCIPHLSSSTLPPPFFHPNPYTRISKLSSKMTKPSWVRSLPALADIKLPYNVLCLIVVFLSLIRETQSTASVLKQEVTALFQVFTLQMTLFDSHIFFSSDQTNDSKSNKNQKRWAYYSFEMPPQFYLGVALYLLKSPTCNFNSQIFA